MTDGGFSRTTASSARGEGGRGSLRRRSRSGGEDGEIDAHGTWAISYGDMITLLLTFFILYFNLESKPGQKSDALLESMVSQLSQMDSKAKDSAAKAVEEAIGGGVKDEKLQVGTLPEKGIEAFLPVEFGAVVHKVGNQVVVEFPSQSFFELGKVEVSEEGRKVLQKFATLYLPFAGTHLLGIRAYTDLKPVRELPNRRFKDNLELSALRAVATMRLLQKGGVPLQRMKLGGYGELKITLQQLRKLAAEKNDRAKESELVHSLARKVVLVIEPEPADGGKGK
jgi:chemotaxis protein MotB